MGGKITAFKGVGEGGMAWVKKRYVKCCDLDPHWSYADPDQQNFMNADLDPNLVPNIAQ